MTIPALGIDIAKLKFNVRLINQIGKLKHKVFPNTEVGFQQLAQWITKQNAERVHACLEATGTYGERLALHLHAAGHMVSVINPAAIKAYAGAQLSRTKTDRVDAELIARFARRSNPSAGHRQRRKYTSCKALVRRLERLPKCVQQNQTGSKRQSARMKSCAAHWKTISSISMPRSSAPRSSFARTSTIIRDLKSKAHCSTPFRHRSDDCRYSIG
jgi:transposase